MDRTEVLRLLSKRISREFWTCRVSWFRALAACAILLALRLLLVLGSSVFLIAFLFALSIVFYLGCTVAARKLRSLRTLVDNPDYMYWLQSAPETPIVRLHFRDGCSTETSLANRDKARLTEWFVQQNAELRVGSYDGTLTQSTTHCR